MDLSLRLVHCAFVLGLVDTRWRLASPTVALLIKGTAAVVPRCSAPDTIRDKR